MRFVFLFSMAKSLIYVDLFSGRRRLYCKMLLQLPTHYIRAPYPLGPNFRRFSGIAPALAAIFPRGPCLWVVCISGVIYAFTVRFLAALPFHGGECR